jgi:hypothetical protein
VCGRAERELIGSFLLLSCSTEIFKCDSIFLRTMERGAGHLSNDPPHGFRGGGAEGGHFLGVRDTNTFYK